MRRNASASGVRQHSREVLRTRMRLPGSPQERNYDAIYDRDCACARLVDLTDLRPGRQRATRLSPKEWHYVQPEKSLGQRALDGLSMMGVMGPTMATTDLVEGRIAFLRIETQDHRTSCDCVECVPDALLESMHELDKVPALKSVSPTWKSDGILLGLKVRQRSNPFSNPAICEQL